MSARQVPDHADRWARSIVFLAMFATGLASLLYEVVLISVVSTVIGVTEKSAALVLSAFLLGLALGALLGGRLSKFRLPYVTCFVVIELLVALFGFIGMWLITMMNHLAPSRGVLFWLILIVLLIPTTLMGMEIPFAVRILNRRAQHAGRDAGFVYFADTLGGVLGALFAGMLLIPRLGFHGAMYLGGILNCTTAILASRINRRPSIGIPALAVLGCSIAIFVLLSATTALHASRLSFLQSMSSVRTTYTEVTPFQHIQILDSPFYGNMLHLDNQLQVTEGDSFIYHEFLTLPAVALHPNPKTALVIGGGDGGVLYQLLQHNFSITHVELDERVVAVAKQYLSRVHRGALDDPRVEHRITDGRLFLQHPPQQYDIIIIDLPDPSRVQLSLLYSKEFYTLVRSALTPNGVMVTQSVSALSYLETTASIYRTVRTVFPNAALYSTVTPSFGMVSFTIASADDTQDPRVPSRPIAGKWYDAKIHSAMFALPKFIREYLIREDIPTSTDDEPAVTLFMDPSYYAQGVRDE